jgi:hypothetical protein
MLSFWQSKTPYGAIRGRYFDKLISMSQLSRASCVHLPSGSMKSDVYSLAAPTKDLAAQGAYCHCILSQS